MNSQIPLAWRQVRIFTRNFTDQWYFDLLATFVRPFAEQFLNTAFFFSRYACEEGQAHSDTDMNQLPADYWLVLGGNRKRRHLSLRLRFAADQEVETFLRDRLRLEAKGFWHHSFLNYDALGGLGGVRFYPGQDEAGKLQRVDLVGTLLYANAKLVLHSMRHNGSKWSFEENSHAENTDHKITSASIIHMINNPAGLVNGSPIPLYIAERDLDGQPQKFWKI